MTVRRVAGILGTTLVGAGVLILAFVAYQLWGTAITESHSQDQLRQQFHHEAALSPVTTPTTVPSDGFAAGPAPATLAPSESQPVGIIQIPKIGVNKVVVEGTAHDDLEKGPGHYAGTPLPGQPGNASIAGHRTTYGAPFYNLDQVGSGDQIIVTTLQGRFRYVVFRSLVVSPSDRAVIGSTLTNQLTLTTCNPRYSAAQRLVVQASLVGQPAPAPLPTHDTRRAKGGLSNGLAGSSGGWLPAVLWGLAVTAVLLAVVVVARRLPGRWTWLAYGCGVIPVAVVLFVFFENVSPLLPASF